MSDLNNLARQLHSLRGYCIAVKCNRVVKAKRLNLTNINEEKNAALKFLYIGASGSGDREIHLENDLWVYKKLFSPFPEEPRQNLTWGMLRDQDANLWGDGYSHVFLKDEDLFDKGIEIIFEVSEVLAEKKPEVSILCNGEIIYEKKIETAGTYQATCSLKDIDNDLVRYIAEIRRQHQIMLSELQRVFDKYHLRYYLIGGSLLGIVRNGCLVPWDDDLDIAMPRKDFDRLREVAKDEWDGTEFLCLEPEKYGQNVFFDFMTRFVYMKETIEADPFERNGNKGRADIHNHLPIDIYVLDPTEPKERKQKIKVQKLRLLYALALGHRGTFQPQKVNFSKSTLLVANLLRKIGRHLGLSFLFRAYNKTISVKPSMEQSEYYYQSNGYFRCFGKTFRQSIFGNGKEISVAGLSVRVPDDPDAFLKAMYGDYLQYPAIWYRRPNYIETTWIH